jgi:hypothetical protein
MKKIHQICLNVPPAMHEAVTARAARELISASDYVRRALLAQFERDGIELEPSAPRRPRTPSPLHLRT